ncbi:MAG: methyltransferase domain-containing protein [Desulfobacterales bacterium]|jgi:2-polyprenyl-3-methyl-5-hydroxy-6-metoxy-1,4-benzoquinol methylase
MDNSVSCGKIAQEIAQVDPVDKRSADCLAESLFFSPEYHYRLCWRLQASNATIGCKAFSGDECRIAIDKTCSFSKLIRTSGLPNVSVQKEKIVYQDGIVTGNIEDKSNLKNPISKILVQRFDRILFQLIEENSPASIHEVGCGEGRITRKLPHACKGPIRASDFSSAHINALRTQDLSNVAVVERNIYELNREEDQADLIICCEVLEHLEDPHKALRVLEALGCRNYIFSVPREPLWRILNVIRGKYIQDWGNTPGHLNHWSKNTFINFLEDHGFRLARIACPLPWIMVRGRF